MIHRAPDDPLSGDLYTVTEITDALRQHLETEFPEISVIGEVANFKAHSSGHYYFSLRDESNMLRIVLFRRYARASDLTPENGMLLVVKGRVSHYGGSGQTQLLAHTMVEAGRGEMEIAQAGLLRKLMEEGLTASERKRPIPAYPSRLAVITSATGAVIQDIADTLSRRWPIAELVHIEADVQGAGSERSILAAFDISDGMDGIDAVILARGGGSIEDLWTFNLESVARAVASSRHPVITGIGHEVDTTVVDFVSDLRAATPTAAAEMATPHIGDVIRRVEDLIGSLESLARRGAEERLRLLEYLLRSSAFPAIVYELERSELRRADLEGRLANGWMDCGGGARDRLTTAMECAGDAFDRSIAMARQAVSSALQGMAGTDPTRSVLAERERVARCEGAIRMQVGSQIRLKGRDVAERERALSGLDTLAVLARGYTYCTAPGGERVIGHARDIAPGEDMVVHFDDGNALCAVREKRRGARWRRKRASKSR